MVENSLKVLFHHPLHTSINAGRTIYHGYKHAFEDLGYSFKTLTSEHNSSKEIDIYRPNIFITSLTIMNLKFLSLEAVKKAKRNGMKVFVLIPFWNSPISRNRLNETPSVSSNTTWVDLIKSGDFGDIYYNICEQGDPRMDGFEKTTGYKHHTILLAADIKTIYPEFSDKFSADISYVGTLLPEKKRFFQDTIFPLKNKYVVKTYGQDWTLFNTSLGLIQKAGQYFNIPLVKSIRKSQLQLDDERKIYSSSKVSINIHESYQREYGDLNERTFKIPASKGFQICDNVKTITKYFTDGKDIVIAKDSNDWKEKIEYYINKRAERQLISEEGFKTVINNHTYHHRVKQMLQIYNTLT